MKKIFTKMKFALVAGIALMTFQLQGQAILNVDGLGTYQGSLGNFGINNPCDLGTISGSIRLADDGTTEITGCDPFIDSNLNGKIAVLNRGGCGFEQKAANLEANGAIAAVICNNEPGRRPMGPTDNFTSNIPAILLSLQDCFNLLNALEGGSELSASIQQDPVALPDVVNIVWGDQPGQGEFDGGLNGWTSENCSVDNQGNVSSPLSWQWYENPIEGFFSSQMISYSRCNGAAGYEATLWNLDPANNADLTTANNYPNHHCELLSPIIDLSSAGPVSLQFWQVNFSLNGNDNPGDPVSRIFISYDGGMTWPEQVNVESGNILTADQTVWANGELRRYFLPQLAGEPNVRLRFEFHGDFYSWYIDDVYFIETPDNSLTINQGVYGMQPSARTPLNLVEPIIAIGEVSNTGLQDQPNTAIDVNYTGPSSTFSTAIDLGTVQSDSVAFDCSTAEAYTPSETGTYTVNMTARSDNMDFDLSDNVLDFSFEVTDSIWSKDAGEVNGTVRPGNDVNNFVWGPVFSVSDDYSGNDMIYGLEFGFQLSDSIDGTDQFLTWSILEWNDANDDGTSQANERTTLESGFVLFSYRDGVDNEMTTYNLEDLPDNNPIAIEAGKNYVIAVQWDNPDRAVNLFGYNGYDYLGMRVAYDDCSPVNRFNDLIGVGSTDISGDWSTGGWTSGVVPAMRLITKPIVTSNNEITQDFNLSLFPNPVGNELTVDIDFEEVVENLEINITDITGKTVALQRDSKVTSNRYTFDLSNQNTGVYFAKIQTDEGIATKRFVVSR